MTTMLPPDHPERSLLADEAHARPPQALQAPLRATHLAVLVPADEHPAELAHLDDLCGRFSAAAPPPGARHFSARLGPLHVKWERHGEFSGYTFVVEGAGSSVFGEPAAALLPPGWLAAVPGQTIVAAHAELLPAGATAPDAATLADHFEGHTAVGAVIGDGAALAFSDFRVHADGCARFLVFDRELTPRQAGRTLQRLFEIEAYRMLALLALPLARAQATRVVTIEQSLAALTGAIAGGATGAAGSGDDEALLHELTRLAAEVENGLAASQFRFGACKAYAELVGTRIAELREQRLPGLQTIEEFMARRFTPAVATCVTVSQRLHDLSERVAQASALLSTRVDIARERQNQALLASMDRRAHLQLRLQQTVEGLSVAAITYYTVGVIGYVAKGLKAGGLAIDPELTAGLAVPVVALAVMWGLRRARRHLGQVD